MIIGFSVLIGMTVSAYQVAPPIPEKVVSADGTTIFTGADISSGQEVFLKYGLMENGTVWGHGAYLGPDFSAEYLHTLGLEASAAASGQLYNKTPDALTPAEKAGVEAQVASSSSKIGTLHRTRHSYSPMWKRLRSKIKSPNGRPIFRSRRPTQVCRQNSSATHRSFANSRLSLRGPLGHPSRIAPAKTILTRITSPMTRRRKQTDGGRDSVERAQSGGAAGRHGLGPVFVRQL